MSKLEQKEMIMQDIEKKIGESEHEIEMEKKKRKEKENLVK